MSETLVERFGFGSFGVRRILGVRGMKELCWVGKQGVWFYGGGF